MQVMITISYFYTSVFKQYNKGGRDNPINIILRSIIRFYFYGL